MFTDEFIAITFGKVLRDLRKSQGKSQEVLGLDAGLERTFISMLELGQRGPSLATQVKLAEGLNISLKELIDMFETELLK
ncbi:hypothetical protein A7981_00455 [Methylovorus sp. MM2]|nr:hypothetical protein A7981_00455 [Methylovorus sp. MM2]